MGGWDEAIEFVRQRGNRLDQLRLRRALAEPYTITEAEEVLNSYQFSDGSWDYNAPEEEPERIGSLGGTIHCLRRLREFGLGGNQMMIHTLEFWPPFRLRMAHSTRPMPSWPTRHKSGFRRRRSWTVSFSRQPSLCASYPSATWDTRPLSRH